MFGNTSGALGFGQQQPVGGMNLGASFAQQQPLQGTGNPPFEPTKVHHFIRFLQNIYAPLT
jgi:hypothetical protein